MMQPCPKPESEVLGSGVGPDGCQDLAAAVPLITNDSFGPAVDEQPLHVEFSHEVVASTHGDRRQRPSSSSSSVREVSPSPVMPARLPQSEVKDRLQDLMQAVDATTQQSDNVEEVDWGKALQDHIDLLTAVEEELPWQSCSSRVPSTTSSSRFGAASGHGGMQRMRSAYEDIHKGRSQGVRHR